MVHGLDLADKKRVEVRLAGFGGQGIVLAGAVLGRAACVYAGRNAVMSQSFGPEARGGACSTEIIISDEEIGYPRATAPDVVVVMSQEAYKSYALRRPPDCPLIVDEDLVKPDEELEAGRLVLPMPATRTAEGLGRRMIANIVMLGFLCGTTELVSVDALREAVTASVPKGTEALNLRAFEAGHDLARKLLSGRQAAEAGR